MTPDQIKRYFLDMANSGIKPEIKQAIENTVNPVTNKSGQVRDAIQNEKNPHKAG